MAQCFANWSCATKERGVTLGDFETRMCAVTGYEAFQQRQFQEDGDVVTRTYLRLELQQNEGPEDRRTTLALITFSALAGSRKIGRIVKRRPPHTGEFELDVTLPAAEFDHYWNILTHEGQPHLRCTITPHEGVGIEEFTLASAKFPEGEPP